MTHARILCIVAAFAIAVLIVVAVSAPREAASGWLLAFTYIAAFPLGSLALLMIHRLTGGNWGEALEPVLRPLALTTPLLVLLIIPVLVATPILFPWQHGANGEVTQSVRLLYLNIPSYAARSLLALAGLSGLAFFLPAAEDRAAPFIAGIGLVFYGLVVNYIGLDWILAAEPVFFSTSFGASVAFAQLLSALALAAIVAPRGHSLPDLGALLLVLTLAITYTDFMAVLVMWYGDVPSKVFWFVERVREPWLAIAVAAFIITSLVPIALLIFARVRTSRVALRFHRRGQPHRSRRLPELAPRAGVRSRDHRDSVACAGGDDRVDRRRDYRGLDARNLPTLEHRAWPLNRACRTGLRRRAFRAGRSSCWPPACSCSSDSPWPACGASSTSASPTGCHCRRTNRRRRACKATRRPIWLGSWRSKAQNYPAIAGLIAEQGLCPFPSIAP